MRYNTVLYAYLLNTRKNKVSCLLGNYLYNFKILNYTIDDD